MFDFDELEESEQQPRSPLTQPAPLGRRIRILSLHGGGSNQNINKYQSKLLQQALAEYADWDFLEGTIISEKEPEGVMKSLAQGAPIRSWYNVETEDKSDRPYSEKLFDHSVEFHYRMVNDGTQKVLEHLKSKGPFDIIVGFSQGCIITHLITGLLRERNEEPSWRLSVFFSGMGVRDKSYAGLFDTPLRHPTAMVFGRQDEFYSYGKDRQTSMYENPLILEHDEGHKFPANNEQGKEIYAKVKKEILWHCGINI